MKGKYVLGTLLTLVVMSSLVVGQVSIDVVNKNILPLASVAPGQKIEYRVTVKNTGETKLKTAIYAVVAKTDRCEGIRLIDADNTFEVCCKADKEDCYQGYCCFKNPSGVCEYTLDPGDSVTGTVIVSIPKNAEIGTYQLAIKVHDLNRGEDVKVKCESFKVAEQEVVVNIEYVRIILSMIGLGAVIRGLYLVFF